MVKFIESFRNIVYRDEVNKWMGYHQIKEKKTVNSRVKLFILFLTVDTDGSETVLYLFGIEDPCRRCVHQVGIDL